MSTSPTQLTRRRFPARLLSLLVAATAAGSFLSTDAPLFESGVYAQNGPVAARVARLIGQARIRGADDSAWRPLRIGSAVTDGDSIETGKSSQLIIVHRGVQIRLGPRTRSRVDTLLEASRPGKVRIERGYGWFKVNGKKRQNGFSVQTPTAVAGVRGTMFAITQNERGMLSCVCEGSVETATQGSENRKIVETGGSLAYAPDGETAQKDLSEYFRGLKADRSFQSQILKDGRLNYCKSCHRMTNLATDDSPDPETY